MTSDQERYKICLQCTEELRSRVIFSGRYSKEWKYVIDISIDEMKEKARSDGRWLNLAGIRRGNLLCHNCPYVLEHVVLAEDGKTKIQDG